ncbi:unnamed protein product [Nesidiocoris tenuis]|uniref:Uncharacterized protein n=1 Tax=Nesidiocoris tenuis TaxID=355587 RepID=A0A6H5GSG1_9HEMI|nr:unnamed protein product [Nesidiocoris tenuis]
MRAHGRSRMLNGELAIITYARGFIRSMRTPDSKKLFIEIEEIHDVFKNTSKIQGHGQGSNPHILPSKGACSGSDSGKKLYERKFFYTPFRWSILGRLQYFHLLYFSSEDDALTFRPITEVVPGVSCRPQGEVGTRDEIERRPEPCWSDTTVTALSCFSKHANKFLLPHRKRQLALNHASYYGPKLLNDLPSTLLTKPNTKNKKEKLLSWIRSHID